jgi:hypothetical protein
VADVILDSNVLADFLAQYFNPAEADRGRGSFVATGPITRGLASRLNRILTTERGGWEPLGPNVTREVALVVASSFAFVEIVRNWDSMVQDRFTVEMFHAFICQPPEWFDIAPVDEDLLPSLERVPRSVADHSRLVPIELPDALHVATTVSRGERALLATTDQRLRSMGLLAGRLAT